MCLLGFKFDLRICLMYVLVGLIIHVNDGGFAHVPVPVLLLIDDVLSQS